MSSPAMSSPAIETVGEAIDFLSTLPRDTKLCVYNRDAMSHTPVTILYIGPYSGGCLHNVAVVQSATAVVTEDYD